MIKTAENEVISSIIQPPLGMIPYEQLPTDTPYQRGDKIGIDGEIYLLVNDSTKVVKTNEFAAKTNYAACLNRMEIVKRLYPDYKDRYPNVLFAEDIYEFRVDDSATVIGGKPFHVFTSDPRVVDVVMERMDGDLQDLLEQFPDLSTEDLKNILIGTTRGMEQLLSMGLTLGDLKLQNFLYKRINGELRIFISDFENSKVLPYTPKEYGTSTKEEFLNDAKYDRLRYASVIGNHFIPQVFGSEVAKLLEEFSSIDGALMTYEEFENKLNSLI